LDVSGGFTLIEMIVILVVVSIVAVALFGAITANVARSADPMIRMQAIAIAQGYLEEALLQAYADPDGGETGGCEEGSRPQYDDVQDYDCINGETPTDQFDNSPVLLDDYTVDISVTGTTLDPGGMPAQRVEVTVSHPQFSTTLTGHRGNH
jgi:MSHA pilin protein MshD